MMQEVRNWYEMAAMDLGVARHLDRTYYPKPLEIICYHCQQSAEKVIKALIVYYGAEGGIPKLHDLSFLLNQIKNKVPIEDKFYDYADALSPYGVAVRYPNEMYLEERHAREALQYAGEIFQWVKEILEEKSADDSE